MNGKLWRTLCAINVTDTIIHMHSVDMWQQGLQSVRTGGKGAKGKLGSGGCLLAKTAVVAPGIRINSGGEKVDARHAVGKLQTSHDFGKSACGR